MVELADKVSEAAWKIKNLEDYEGRLGGAARRFDELSRERPEPAMVIYASALKKSGRSEYEIRGMVREFRETFEDEEEPLTIIARQSKPVADAPPGIASTEPDNRS